MEAEGKHSGHCFGCGGDVGLWEEAWPLGSTNIAIRKAGNQLSN
jgi:hypothetical protein